jgi:hypothetical protein
MSNFICDFCHKSVSKDNNRKWKFYSIEYKDTDGYILHYIRCIDCQHNNNIFCSTWKCIVCLKEKSINEEHCYLQCKSCLMIERGDSSYDLNCKCNICKEVNEYYNFEPK